MQVPVFFRLLDKVLGNLTTAYSGKRKAKIVSVLGNIYLERECMFVRTKGKGLKEMDGLVSVFSVGKAIYRHYFKLY